MGYQIQQGSRMVLTGKISKINEDLGFGFIKCPKSEDVFFSEKTEFVGLTFPQLKMNDSVRISVVETERGLFAERIERAVRVEKQKSPEQTI